MSSFFSQRGALSFFSRLERASRLRLKRVFWVALSLGAGVWMWQWLGTDEKGEPIAELEGPILEVEGLQPFLVRRDGKPLWEISARRTTLEADGRVATGVERGTFFRDGKPFIRFSAPRVRLTTATNDLEAMGGVSATGPAGFSFHTSRASWRQGEQIVDCPQPATAWLRGLWFQTPRLAYFWQSGNLSCPDAVEMRGQGIVMRGQNLVASTKTRQVSMNGGVRIVIAARVVKRTLPLDQNN
ncbi:MAG TPA: hypothetical protein VF627_01960 [Abditibacterium sp.]|jgi:hypothetical protein